ncbi:MAG: hypothetical protein ACREHE_10890, partial [Rhizomicrobium sp.]
AEAQPAGQVVSNIYYGDLLLTYNVGNVAIAWTFPNRFISQIQAGGPNNNALLGMDMLASGVLVLDGTQNSMTFCW